MEKKLVEKEASNSSNPMATNYSSIFSDQIPMNFPSLPNTFDIPMAGGADSLGFLDILSLQDYPFSTIYDMIPPLPPPPPLSSSLSPLPPPLASNNNSLAPEPDQAVTTPVTPNSSSFSSTSSETLNDDQKIKNADGDEGDDQSKSKKHIMANSNLLALANTTAGSLNFQIPPISIKLDRDNYSLWRTNVVSALETFDLEAHIFAPSPPPETLSVTDANGVVTISANPEFTAWKKRDRYVLLWIKSTLSERALALVSRATSSQMAWTTIEKTFQAQTGARRMAMKNQLQTLMKGSLPMLEYIERKRSIADSLAENMHPISDEDLNGHILNGLDSSYGPFTSAFMVKGVEGASVDDLVGMLLQEEARLEQEHLRQLSTQPSSGSSVLTVNRRGGRSAPSNNNYTSSRPSYGSRSSDSRRRREPCQICKKMGHEARDCWERNNKEDYPPLRPNPREQSRQANIVQHGSSSMVVDPSWYFDTGATDHVTPDMQKLAIVDNYNGDDKLQVGNGQNNPPRGRPQ